MNLLACGISHKTAPVALRERFAIPVCQQKAFLDKVLEELPCKEAVFLATCNRCEVYTITSDQASFLSWLAKTHRIPEKDFMSYMYVHQGEEAIRHMMNVACGMDSMIFGEPEIFGQIKSAVTLAKELGTLGSTLQTVFQHVFTATKRVRTNTVIGQQPTSVANAAVNLAHQMFTDFSKLSVVLVGAGDMAYALLLHLSKLGLKNIHVVNRNVARAKTLASRFANESYDLDALPGVLKDADLVFTATASPDPIITQAMVSEALADRADKMTYFIDLAVPRNIEPNIAKLDNVRLYNMDDLQNIVEVNIGKRRLAAMEAETIIAEELQQCLLRLSTKNHHLFIKKVRDKAQIIKEQELKKALLLIEAGHAPEQVLTRLAHNITNKLLHEPTLQIKQLSRDEIENLLNLVS